MCINLSLAQREACEAIWRAIEQRQEIVLGLYFDPKAQDRSAVRYEVAQTVALLDRDQVERLVAPDMQKHGPVRRDFVWRWSPVDLRKPPPCPL